MTAVVRNTMINTCVTSRALRAATRRPSCRDLAAPLGGGMNGTFRMHDITGAQVSELHATLHNVALASVQALAN
jgi:hypothetical protein